MTPHKKTLPEGLCICREPECKIPYGTCHCGCGKITTIAVLTDNGTGKIAGRPTKFLVGHNRRHIRHVDEAAPFKIDGVYCRLIPLTKGKWTIVWQDHYKTLMQRKWIAQLNQSSGTYYANSTVTHPDGKRTTLCMARFILGLSDDDPRIADHQNRVTLDNRDDNLRIVTLSQNSMNKKKSSNNTSGRKGVSWHCRKNKYQARIMVGGVNYNLGDYWNFEDACLAREAGEIKYHGKYACKG